MEAFILTTKILTLIFVCILAPQYISQIPRAIVHNHGWKTSLLDVLFGLSASMLIIHGMP